MLLLVTAIIMASKDPETSKQCIDGKTKYGISMIPQKLDIIKGLGSTRN
jgi:hypothetical protein